MAPFYKLLVLLCSGLIPGNGAFWIFLDSFVDNLPATTVIRSGIKAGYIVDLVKQGRPWSAKWELDNSKNPIKNIRTVIKQVYNDKSIRNPSENVANLLVEYTMDKNSSKTCSAIQQGLAEMRKERDISSTTLIVVDYLNSFCPGEKRDSEVTSAITSSIMQKWTEQIWQQDYYEVSQFCSRFEKIPVFRKYLHELFRAAYSTSEAKLNSVGKFLNGRYCDDEVTVKAWSALLNVTLEESPTDFNRNILKIAEWLWQWERVSRIRFVGNSVLKSELTSVRERLPDKLRKMVWNGWCTFKNFKTGKYILASKNGTKHLFMEYSIGPGTGGRLGDSEGWWYLEKTLKPVKSLKKKTELTFAIKTLEFLRNRPFLCANYTKSALKTTTSLDVGTIEMCYRTGAKKNMMVDWIIEPVEKINESGSNNLFQMYTMNRDKSRRFYFYEVPGNPVKEQIFAGDEASSKDESYWDIECQ